MCPLPRVRPPRTDLVARNQERGMDGMDTDEAWLAVPGRSFLSMGSIPSMPSILIPRYLAFQAASRSGFLSTDRRSGFRPP